MDEKQFDTLARSALRKLEEALGDHADDLDVDLADGILEIEFADGTKFVINSHAAARQIWMSANMTAAHFGWDEAAREWRDTKTGRELFAELGRNISEKLAQPVTLKN